MNVASVSVTLGFPEQDGFTPLKNPVIVADVLVPGLGVFRIENCLTPEILDEMKRSILEATEVRLKRNYPIKVISTGQ